MRRRKWSGFYWMAVTPDEYELPLAVAQSSGELAEMLGMSPGAVLGCEAKNANGRNTGRKIIKFKAV